MLRRSEHKFRRPSSGEQWCSVRRKAGQGRRLGLRPRRASFAHRCAMPKSASGRARILRFLGGVTMLLEALGALLVFRLLLTAFVLADTLVFLIHASSSRGFAERFQARSDRFGCSRTKENGAGQRRLSHSSPVLQRDAGGKVPSPPCHLRKGV